MLLWCEISPFPCAFDVTHRAVIDRSCHVAGGAAEQIDGPVREGVDELLEVAASGG
ncbi:hypothetical protein [Mesorhizobium sp. M0968]|uniref:hypothetical protein n=1 Tax=Mesorhizobium sp. M0968 TaxID=2957037 RepID=UPI00333D90B5